MAATTTGLSTTPETERTPRAGHTPLMWTLILPLLTAVMLAVGGFHPLAEDGGLYVAGIEYRLDPTLFPHYTSFVTEHLRFSIFASTMAGVVRLMHLPLAWVLLLAYLFSLCFTLYAALLILRRCTPNEMRQLSGVALLAVWSTLPVAGTSLVLVDPYLTARSFTTPLSLIAIAFALDAWDFNTSTGRRSFAMCAFVIGGAGALHPLMAAYAFALVVLLRVLRSRHAYLFCAALVASVLLLASALHKFALPDSPAAVSASLSRYYWFLSQWEWYEIFGLIGPVVILLLLQQDRVQPSAATKLLARAAIVAGISSALIALCFAHKESSTYLVARMQPLRVFLLIYATMTLLLGTAAAQWLAELYRRSEARSMRVFAFAMPSILFVISGVALFSAQRAIFSASQHIEWPWFPPTNRWSQAFVWARDNTPRDALFALDADYITTDREDAQTFRATSLRSALPDFSKDGGEASITPSLAPLWQQSMTAQFAVQSGTHLIAKATLSRQNDTERDAHLQPLGVSWVLLQPDAQTAHSCPYNNGTVKVCRIQ